ncbi:MAG TPA: flavin reductase family protein [Arachidicoccus sp.]
MLTFDTTRLSPVQLQNYLQYAIAPRPICLASTIDKNGQINLSPFSFFNMFSTNPPICVFAPARRVRDNTTKHTYENILEVKQCVINIVNYEMVQQMSLSSAEYPKGINEFDKAGFTMLKSDLVQPPRVAESAVQFECTVNDVVELGKNAGAGALIIAEIKLIHINENILDSDGKIDQQKIDLVARLGGDWYCRVSKENLFKVPKPLKTPGIGVGALPEQARNSTLLTGNDLGLLGSAGHLPTQEEMQQIRSLGEVKNILETKENVVKKLHMFAHQLLQEEKMREALAIIFLSNEQSF